MREKFKDNYPKLVGRQAIPTEKVKADFEEWVKKHGGTIITYRHKGEIKIINKNQWDEFHNLFPII